MPASEPNAPPRFHKTYAIRPQSSLQPRDCCCDACHGHMDFIWISYGFHGNLMGIWWWWSLVELITKYTQALVPAGGFSQAIRGWDQQMEQGLQHPGGWLLEAMEGVLRTSSNSGEFALALTGRTEPWLDVLRQHLPIMSTCPAKLEMSLHYDTCYPLLRGSK